MAAGSGDAGTAGVCLARRFLPMEWAHRNVCLRGVRAGASGVQHSAAFVGESRPAMSIKKLLFAAPLFVFVGCGQPEPVASLRVSPSTLTLKPGRCSELTMEWQIQGPLREAGGEPIVFLHVSEKPNLPLRTFDHPFPRRWVPGEKVVYQLPVCQSLMAPAPTTPPTIVVAGLYDRMSGHRWPLETSSPPSRKKEYTVAAARMDTSAKPEQVSFEGAWGPVLPVNDRQVIARRSVDGEASIVTPVAASVRLSFHVAEPGTASPAVESSCAAGRSHPLNRGTQQLDLPACPNGRITVRPNGAVMFLESIAWRS